MLPTFSTAKVPRCGNYWTVGEGAAKWKGVKHKWSTLNKLLKAAGVPAKEVDGLTTNIIESVMPGYMKTKGEGFK